MNYVSKKLPVMEQTVACLLKLYTSCWKLGPGSVKEFSLACIVKSGPGSESRFSLALDEIYINVIPLQTLALLARVGKDT